MGWTAILQRGNLDEESAARGLATIERNAKIQHQLISDLLDVSRIISGQLRFETAVVDLIVPDGYRAMNERQSIKVMIAF